MFKPFLTVQNIAIVLLLALVGYFVWNYNSMGKEIVSLRSELAIANEAIVLANNKVATCYSEMDDVQKDFTELQEDFNLLFDQGLDAVEEICTRRDTLNLLNDGVSLPENVEAIEESINERFNRRNF
jgi:hypothetical protein